MMRMKHSVAIVGVVSGLLLAASSVGLGATSTYSGFSSKVTKTLPHYPRPDCETLLQSYQPGKFVVDPVYQNWPANLQRGTCTYTIGN